MTLIESAAKEGRDYVTPEDVQDVISSGIEKLALYEDLLGHLERGNVEDFRLCCFVALEWKLDADKEPAKFGPRYSTEAVDALLEAVEHAVSDPHFDPYGVETLAAAVRASREPAK